MKDNYTDFGFKKVRTDEKQKLVEEVFSSVAPKYDLMNDLMSFGLHRLWKDRLIEKVNLSANQKYKIIDVASGTGDIAFRLLKKAKKNQASTKIEVVDINPKMLKIGKDLAIDRSLFSKLNFIEANGERLPYQDGEFDYYTISFGIRNFSDIKQGLKEAYRVLKPNGKFFCLEFSQVNNLLFSEIYDLYSFKIIPKIGEIVAKDRDSYQYLVESIKKFPDQEKFKKMIEEAGFKEVNYYNLSCGTVAIHTAIKN